MSAKAMEIRNIIKNCEVDVHVVIFLLVYFILNISLSNILGPSLYSIFIALIHIGVLTYDIAISILSGGVAYLVFYKLSEKGLRICSYIVVVIAAAIMVVVFNYFWLIFHYDINNNFSIKTFMLICFVKVIPMSVLVLVNDIGLRKA